jgi:hypothetical protein
MIVILGRCKRADRNPDATSLGSGQIQVRSLHRVQVRSQALEAKFCYILLCTMQPAKQRARYPCLQSDVCWGGYASL